MIALRLLSKACDLACEEAQRDAKREYDDDERERLRMTGTILAYLGSGIGEAIAEAGGTDDGEKNDRLLAKYEDAEHRLQLVGKKAVQYQDGHEAMRIRLVNARNRLWAIENIAEFRGEDDPAWAEVLKLARSDEAKDDG